MSIRDRIQTDYMKLKAFGLGDATLVDEEGLTCKLSAGDWLEIKAEKLENESLRIDGLKLRHTVLDIVDIKNTELPLGACDINMITLHDQCVPALPKWTEVNASGMIINSVSSCKMSIDFRTDTESGWIAREYFLEVETDDNKMEALFVSINGNIRGNIKYRGRHFGFESGKILFVFKGGEMAMACRAEVNCYEIGNWPSIAFFIRRPKQKDRLLKLFDMLGNITNTAFGVGWELVVMTDWSVKRIA